MADIIHRVGIQAPPSKVYAAVTTLEGIAGWWTRETTGQSKSGETIKVQFRHPDGRERGKMTFELSKLDPDREVRWRFVAGPEEWLGTEVSFKLSPHGENTMVLFGHRNWPDAEDFMAH
jgi:uncharacterized protein YndB with AHSA1/START domain